MHINNPDTEYLPRPMYLTEVHDGEHSGKVHTAAYLQDRISFVIVFQNAKDSAFSIVGSGLWQHFPLLPSVRDDLVTCRAGLVTCLRACAALVCLARLF